MAKNTNTNTSVAKVETERPEAMTAEVAAARQAVVASATTLENTERASDDAVFHATQAFGRDVLALAAALERAAGRPAVGLTDWSSVRKALCEGQKVPTGKLVVVRGENTVQRAVKLALYVPDAGAIAAYDAMRATVIENGAKPRAGAVAKATASDDVYVSRSIKSLVAWGEAKAKGRLNTASGAIRRDSTGGKKTPEVVARNERIADVAATVALVNDDDVTVRDGAMSALVVPGITVAMLSALSASDLLVLSKVAGDMGRAKAKATPKAKVVPPVLETTAPVAPAAGADPLAGIDPATLAQAVALLTAAKATA